MKRILFLFVWAIGGLTANAQITSAQVAKNVTVSLEMQVQIQEALRQRAATDLQIQNRTLTATYVGSFNTNDGPNWTTNPAALSGTQAAALIFGGSPTDYAISTNPDTSDPLTITHTAWATTWGVPGCQEVAEDYYYDLGEAGYNDPGGDNTAISSYVDDNCTESNTNYVWLVSSSSSPASFITTWQTTSPNESITIPTTGGGYNYTVDWGDGNTDTGVTGDATHVYASPGTYTVTIDGSFPRIYFNNSGDRLKIKSIEQWGTQVWSSMNGAFAGAENLVSNATDMPDLSMVTDTSGMFAFARSFKGDLQMNNWDVSNVTNMFAMFGGASVFNHPIGNWDVGNVTNMQEMFKGATKFNQNIGNWDVGSVTNMKEMFFTAMRFNQNLNNWDVSNVTNMYGLFAHANRFNGAVGNWDVSNVTDMEGTFAYARKFNQNISGWDVGNVTTMRGMFGGASVFNQPIGNWDVSNVTNMDSMFDGATVFNQDISSWNVGNVSSMRKMFRTALYFNQNIGNWDVSGVTNMQQMFEFARRFDQDLGNWVVSNVTNMTLMFRGATLSTANYDALLNGWSTLPLKSNINFHGGDSTYCTGAAARQYIINTYNWTIIDGGMNCGPLLPLGINGNDTVGGGITLYPNPMGSYFNLANPERLQLESVSIYDVTGRLVKNVNIQEVTSEMIIDVSGLTNSTYLVVINGETGRISKLMVKN